jgi:predicted metal-dependent HD superfamily phosphohydrolase
MLALKAKTTAKAPAKEDLDQLLAHADRIVERFLRTNKEIVRPALELLKEIDAKGLQYHNSVHTRMVLNACVLLWAKENQIDLKNIDEHPSLKELLIAAVYHDVGQIEGPKEHELRASKIVHEKLNALLGETACNRIASYILATRMELTSDGKFRQVLAEDINAKILQDADMFNLGSTTPDQQWDISCAIFQENSKSTYGHSLSAINFGIRLFEAHTYQTDSAKKLLNFGKELNLTELRKKADELTLTALTFCRKENLS